MDLTTALTLAVGELRTAGVEGPLREARLLAEVACSLPVERQVADPERILVAEAIRRFRTLVARRASREPFAHLAGHREFMGLRFRVTPDVLVPRPETECIVEAARQGGAATRILDCGTGSGTILLSLLAGWPGATGIGLDRSVAALAVARENARALGVATRVSWVVSDWLQAWGPGNEVDLVVCNPPYVRTRDWAVLDPEVRCHEPRLALDGGEDGLVPVRRILAELPPGMAPGTRLIFETDPRLWDSLARLCAQRGLHVTNPVLDLAGRRRGLVAHVQHTA